MGFFSVVGEALNDMSKVEQNYREISTYAKNAEKSVKSTRDAVSRKKAANSYTIPSDMKKQCKIIQEKYEIDADSMIKEIREDRRMIAESRKQVKSDCQGIADEVRWMEGRFTEVGGKRL